MKIAEQPFPCENRFVRSPESHATIVHALKGLDAEAVPLGNVCVGAGGSETRSFIGNRENSGER